MVKADSADEFSCYSIGASVTLMLYEHWLNLDKEINLVWQAKKWSFLPTFVLVDIYMREIGILFMAIGSLLLPIQHTSTHCPPVTSGYTDLSTEVRTCSLCRETACLDHDIDVRVPFSSASTTIYSCS